MMPSLAIVLVLLVLSAEAHFHAPLCKLNVATAIVKRRKSQHCGLSLLGFAPGLEDLFYTRPKRFHSEVLTSSTGAIRVNRLFEEGRTKSWYAEYQQHGADFVHAGLMLRNDTLLESGLRVLDWAVKRLKDVERFERVGDDARHSTSFFFEAVARTTLLLRAFGQCGNYVDVELMPLLRRLVLWAKNSRGNSMVGQHKFMHIRLMRAAAFLYVSKLLKEDDELHADVAQGIEGYLDDALWMQWNDGSLPEKGGFDVHYQGFSVMYLGRILAVVSDLRERGRVVVALEKGVRRLEMCVRRDGSLDRRGSVRVNRERRRDGGGKTVDYKSAISGLLYASFLLRDGEVYDVAKRMAEFKYHLKWMELEDYRAPEMPWRRCLDREDF